MMALFQDIFSIFKKRDLPLIESFEEAESVFTFRFEKTQDITWRAGQHGLFKITHQKIKDHTRPFTIASAPAENVIQITMKISNQPSEFKKAMLSMEKGDTIKMAGPVGEFCLKEDNSAILVAGGIGITPFRSIIKQIELGDRTNNRHIKLIYLDSSKSNLFKDEFDRIANKFDINLNYYNERENMNKELDKYIGSGSYSTNCEFFVAGPKSMVEATTAYIQNQGISKRNIKKDILFGY